MYDKALSFSPSLLVQRCLRSRYLRHLALVQCDASPIALGSSVVTPSKRAILEMFQPDLCIFIRAILLVCEHLR